MTSQRLWQLNIKLFIWKKVLNNGSFRKFFGLLNFPELELFHLFFFKHYDISIPIIYSNLNKVKLFARCSLDFAFCPLVFGRCSLVVFFIFCWFLVTFCWLLFTFCLLLVTFCSTRNSERFAFWLYLVHEKFIPVLSKSKKQSYIYKFVNKKFNLWITWKLGQFYSGDFQQSLWVLKTK